jgi:hypothetical protein
MRDGRSSAFPITMKQLHSNEAYPVCCSNSFPAIFDRFPEVYSPTVRSPSRRRRGIDLPLPSQHINKYFCRSSTLFFFPHRTPHQHRQPSPTSPITNNTDNNHLSRHSSTTHQKLSTPSSLLPHLLSSHRRPFTFFTRHKGTSTSHPTC